VEFQVLLGVWLTSVLEGLVLDVRQQGKSLTKEGKLSSQLVALLIAELGDLNLKFRV
jgi:hypothetical protein